MSKKKNSYNLKAEKEKRLIEKTNARNKVIITALVLTLLFGVLAVFEALPLSVKFVNKNGAYTDPSTGKAYLPTDPFVYELCGEYYSDNVYGKMDGDNVYVIKDVEKTKWLIRKHGEDLFTLYYEENQTLPTLSELESDQILICIDGALVSVEAKVENTEDITSALEAIAKNERAERPTPVEVYNLRFVSDEFPWLYYCVKYIVAEDGGYFYLYDENVYIKAGTVLDGYIDSIEE